MSRGEGELLTAPKPRAASLLSVCLTVKPVGEPDAGIGTSGSMSGDGKRSVAERPKLPRPSSTLPKRTSPRLRRNHVCYQVASRKHLLDAEYFAF